MVCGAALCAEMGKLALTYPLIPIIYTPYSEYRYPLFRLSVPLMVCAAALCAEIGKLALIGVAGVSTYLQARPTVMCPAFRGYPYPLIPIIHTPYSDYRSALFR